MRTIDLETLKTHLEDEAVILDGLDDCIVGVNQDNYLVYSYGQFLKHFTFAGMTMEESIEYVEYNIIGLNSTKFDVLYELEYMF